MGSVCCNYCDNNDYIGYDEGIMSEVKEKFIMLFESYRLNLSDKACGADGTFYDKIDDGDVISDDAELLDDVESWCSEELS